MEEGPYGRTSDGEGREIYGQLTKCNANNVIYHREARSAAHTNYTSHLRSILTMLKHAKSYNSITI